jgi:hypothetical protein
VTGANVGGPFVVLKICGQSSLGQMTLRSIVMQPSKLAATAPVAQARTDVAMQ